MATVSLYSSNSSDIGRNSAELSFSYSLNNSDNARDTFITLQLFIDNNFIKEISNDVSTITIDNLSAGEQYVAELELTYQKEKLTTIEGYYFSFKKIDENGKEESGFSAPSPIAVAVQFYDYYLAEGYELQWDVNTNENPQQAIEYNGKIYYFYVDTQSKWESDGDPITTSASIVVYTQPEIFYFGDGTSVSSGAKWLIAAGVQSIMPNIYKFNDTATKWKQWNQQSEVTACDAFPSEGTKKNLSAQMLNNAYKYLGQLTSYQKGDKVAASMFSGLEALINQ